MSHIIRLSNETDIELLIDKSSGTYEIMYNGENWLGKGILSLFHNKVWYRNAIGVNHFSEELKITDFYEYDGEDACLGKYTRIELKWHVKHLELHLLTEIKFYHRSRAIVFDLHYPVSNEKLYVVFPQFINGAAIAQRNDLHTWVPGFMGHYGTRHNVSAANGFADPDRDMTAIPLILYDRAYNTMILSPFSDFLVSNQYVETAGGSDSHGFGGCRLICCGLNRHFTIPAGFAHSTVLYFGSGIHETIQDFGRILLKKHDKTRPDKYGDISISYLSYWVDYGSYYWYEFFTKNTALDYEDTMIKLADDARENGLAIKSWEVQDGDQNRWPEGIFDTRPEIIPHGLKYLRHKIGEALYSYFSPLEPGPYREQYPYVYTGHVAYGEIGSVGMGDLFYTGDFWDDQIKKVKEWGCIGLQHDFLSNYWNTPAAVDYIDRYMKSMAKACMKHGIFMQYCMCFSNHLLETAENQAIISLQAIADHHPSEAEGGCGENLRAFIYSSSLYGALGLWPARDNIQTRNDADAYEDVLVANLSAGPIQLGHAVGKADTGLLRKTFREADGLLLKPDRPISPINECFLTEDYLIACTESANEAGVWKYVLSLNIGNEGRRGGSFSPGACGCRADGYILYDYNEKRIRKLERNGIFRCPDRVKHSYYILSPILEGGRTIIGDTGKFITMADRRINNITCTARLLKFDLLSGRGFGAVVAGYAQDRPRAMKIDGKICRQITDGSVINSEANAWHWEMETGLWQINASCPETKAVTPVHVEISWQP